jgi:hypothetical protein
MAGIARRVTDKRVLRLIGAFLKVGALENGLVSPGGEGTPPVPSTRSPPSSGWTPSQRVQPMVV